MRPFPLYIATLMLTGLTGGVIGSAGGGAISFFAASSKSCDFETVAIVIVGAVGGAIGLLLGGATGFFAVFTGAAVGSSILLLLGVFVTNHLLAGKLVSSQVLSSRFLLISYLIVATIALAISLVGVPAGWWKE